MILSNTTIAKRFYILILGLVASIALWQSIKYHQTYRNTIWKQENYADCGGYYSHLIMWFDLGYQSSNYPPEYQLERGLGVTTDQGKIVKTKYTCGVAYLLTPFYLGNRLLGSIFNYDTDANAVSNKIMIDVAGSFYWLLGSVFMFLLATKYSSPAIAFISTLLVTLGTNVIFYGTMHPGMSHIYSFFLVSALLYTAYQFYRKPGTLKIIWMGLMASLVVLIRPTNVLILPLILLLAPDRKSVLHLIKPIHLIVIVLGVIVIWMPQCMYWYKLHGSIMFYSYKGESFIYWQHPKILIVLFSPMNGLLLFSPFVLILFLIVAFQGFQKNYFSLYLLFLMIAIVYLSASWHAPAFGCGYGQRNFVDLLPAAVVPLSLQFKRCFEFKRYIPLALLIVFSVGFTLVNLQLIRKYNHCSMAQTYWDFKTYWYNLNPYYLTLKNNYSNYYEPDRIVKENGDSYLIIKPDQQITNLMSIDYYKVPQFVKKGYFKSLVKTNNNKVEFDIEIWVTKNDTIHFGNTMEFTDKSLRNNKWSWISGIIYLQFSPTIPKESGLFVFLINKGNQEIWVDKASILIE